MLKNIVFDMGKVLLDWNPLQACLRHCGDAETAERLCGLLFLTPDWPENIDSGRMTEDEYLAFKLTQASEEDKPLARAILSDYWLDSLYPIPGMEELTAQLLDSGKRLYLLSNVGFRFHDYQNKIRYLNRFSGVVLSCEQGLLKPDPAIYRRLCDLYGILPQETLFVDDVQKNIDGAKSIGMNGLCFTGSPDSVRKAITELD